MTQHFSYNKAIWHVWFQPLSIRCLTVNSCSIMNAANVRLLPPLTWVGFLTKRQSRDDLKIIDCPHILLTSHKISMWIWHLIGNQYKIYLANFLFHASSDFSVLMWIFSVICTCHFKESTTFSSLVRMWIGELGPRHKAHVFLTKIERENVNQGSKAIFSEH